MKDILYIANIRMPTEKAHGVQIMKMCEAFAREGRRVTLLVPRRKTPITEDPFVYYGVDRTFSIVSVPTLDTVSLGRLGFLIETFFFTLSAFLYVCKKKEAVVYSRDEIVLFALTFIAGHTVWEGHTPRNNIIARILTKRVWKMVLISEGLRMFFKDRGVSEEKMIVAHDAVDVEEFMRERVSREDARRMLGLSLGADTVMYIGRIDPWKGVETFLRATRLLPKGIQVVVVGEGGERERLEEEYPEAIFPGALPYKDLSRHQQGADVLVVPNSGKSNVSRLYTSPLKVFAHMASGVPMVVSDLPSMREVLGEEHAYFAEADNPDTWARTIQYVLDHKEESRAKAQAAQKEVVLYTWQKRAGHILSFLHA